VRRVYLIGLPSPALLCVGAVLIADDSYPRIARALIVLAAIGMFVCARIVKRT
jgi:hypothetical protein